MLRVALTLALVSSVLVPLPAESSLPYRLRVERDRTVLTLHGAILEPTATPKVATWHLRGMASPQSPMNVTLRPQSGVLRQLTLRNEQGRLQIDASWRHAVAVRVNPMADRLELTFPHQPARPTYRRISEGVEFWEGQRWTGQGPARVRTLRVDPRKAEVRPALAAPASNGGLSLEKTSAIAARHKAVAAVNGTFFAPRTREPLGLLVMDGHLVSSQLYNRSAFYFLKDGRSMVSNANLQVQVVTDSGAVLRPHAVNQTPSRHQLTLYSDHYGFRTRSWPDPSRWEVALSPVGSIVNVGQGDLPIPLGGFVLSAQGRERAALMQTLGVGSQSRVTLELEKSGKNVAHVIGGGPTLLSGGKVRITAIEERFRKDVTHGRAPRTAVGVDGQGKIMLTTVDGRNPGISAGMTLRELARTLDGLGVQEAINLDGGGSTTMTVQGKLVNRPSDGQERLVSNALIVLPRKQPLRDEPPLETGGPG